LWETLSEGGEKGRCGWPTDKFGVSWQIVPGAMDKLLSGADRAKSEGAMKALPRMGRIDLQKLGQAYEE